MTKKLTNKNESTTLNLETGGLKMEDAEYSIGYGDIAVSMLNNDFPKVWQATVKPEEISNLKEEISSLRLELDSLAGDIVSLNQQVKLKVDRDGVISSINISPESIRIKGDKIHIDGTTLIDDSVK